MLVLSLLLAFSWLSSGCASGAGSFQVKDLAKTDVDMVADLHREETRDLLRRLMIKLYKRNPRELRKMEGQTAENRWTMIESQIDQPLLFDELDGVQGVDAMRLGLSAGFSGDRVFAVSVGLVGMMREAYGYKSEFFWMDTLDQQMLYNSARNIEVLVWLLKSRKDDRGERLLLTDSADGEVLNLSFERLFGKMIAHQDMLSEILADKTQRAVNKVAHGVMSMTFIPI